MTDALFAPLRLWLEFVGAMLPAPAINLPPPAKSSVAPVRRWETLIDMGARR